MADKPYIGRKAGSFIRDKATGELRPDDGRPAEPPKPEKPATPAKSEKGK